MAKRKPKKPGAPKTQIAQAAPEQAANPAKSALMREIAVADPRFGFGFGNFYTRVNYNPDDLIAKKGLKIYSQMRNDEQIKAALLTKKLGAIAAGWEIIVDDENGDSKLLDEQKRFIEFSFAEMEGTVEKFLLNALTALDYGFSLTEPVYKPLDYGEFKGKIALKALKVRRPEQIEFETDQFGNLTENGVRQGNQELPANRFAIYTYRKEFENFYGTSDLREAYRPWFVKDNLIKFMAMCMERFGQPIPIATTQTTLSDTDKAQLLTILQNLQPRTALIIPSTITLDFASPGEGAQAAFGPIMKQLDQWISMAILMPSLIGAGGGQQDVGSNARAETEFDTFLWVLEQLRKDLQEFINDRIVKVLIDLNYEVEDGVYPQFRFKELTHERKMAILDKYDKAMTGKAITKTAEDEEWYRSMADFPELTEGEVPAGTREAQERDLKDQVDQAGKMAKVAPKPVAKPFEHRDYHAEHDQQDHGNRGGALVDKALKQGGFTYNPIRFKGRTPPKNGFALSVAKNTEKVVALDYRTRDEVKAQLKAYVRQHWDKIKSEGNFLGGWIDNGKLYLDISNVVKDKNEAIAKARKADQLAVFDLGRGETIQLKKAA